MIRLLPLERPKYAIGDAASFAVNVLEPRYWDMTQPDAIAFAESIRSAPVGSFVIIELVPERIAFSRG